MAKLPVIPQEYLLSIFEYDEDIGMLIWKYRDDRTPQWNGRYASTFAGYEQIFPTSGPYRLVNVLGIPRLAHRLIWMYLYNEEPDIIDHANGDGLDNRPNNLRNATSSQNRANKSAQSFGFSQRGNRYRARVKMDGTVYELGNYDTVEEAHLAYIQGTLDHQGEFARFNRLIRRI